MITLRAIGATPKELIYQCLMKGNPRCRARHLGKHEHFAALLETPWRPPNCAALAEGTGRGIAPSARSAQGRAVSAAPRTRAGGDAPEIECSSFDFRQARNPRGEFLSVLSLLAQGKYPARRCGNRHQLRRRSRAKPVFRFSRKWLLHSRHFRHPWRSHRNDECPGERADQCLAPEWADCASGTNKVCTSTASKS